MSINVKRTHRDYKKVEKKSLEEYLNTDIKKMKIVAERRKEIKKIIDKKTEKIRKFLRIKLNEDLEDFIKKNSLSKSSEMYINLLNYSLTKKNKTYLENKLGTPEFKHVKDKRPTILFALDIVLGWIIEDACLILLSRIPQIKCTLNDINRRFVINQVTHDINLQYKSTTIPLEIKHDFKGHWKECGSIEFRDNTYNYFSKYYTIIFGIDIKYNQILMINTPTTNITDYIKHHPPFGGKPATSIYIDYKDNFCNWNNWKSKLIDILKERNKRLKEKRGKKNE